MLKKTFLELTHILVDAGYAGKDFATQIKDTIGATVEDKAKRIIHLRRIVKKMGCFCLVGKV